MNPFESMFDHFVEEDEVDFAILQERNTEIAKIEQDTLSISEIMKDLAYLIYDQGEDLKVGEKQIENVVEATGEGLSHLERALKFTEKTRGLIVDASTIVAGTGLGALGFLASPVVGVPTLLGGLATAVSVITIRRNLVK